MSTSDLVQGWRARRDLLRRSLEMMQGGEMRTGKNEGHGWIDTTAENIKQTKQWIADLDALIAAHS